MAGHGQGVNMRVIIPDELEKGRIAYGQFGTKLNSGFNGAYLITGPNDILLRIIAHDGKEAKAQSWEHVSVSTSHRIPYWNEMCFVKNLFWHEEECVVQFHPPKSKYINHHPFVLHLWKNNKFEFQTPPKEFIA